MTTKQVNCPVCDGISQGKEHGTTILYYCLTEGCDNIFFSLDAYKDMYVSRGLDPANILRTKEAWETSTWILFLEPLAHVFRITVQQLSDFDLCELAESALILGDATDARGFTQLMIFVENLLNLEKFRCWTNDEKQVMYEPILFAITISIADEIAQRTSLAQTPEATLLARHLSGRQLSAEETEELARKGQFKQRYNPDFCDSKDEVTNTFWIALLEQLKQNPLPDMLLKGGLLKVMRGCLNSYFPKADNVLRGKAKTSQAQNQRREFIDDKTDLYPVEIYPAEQESEPDKAILLMEIFSQELTKGERQVIQLKLDGRSQKEIAEQLTITQARVSQLLNSARKKIGEHFGLT